jgi:thiosulfate reductase cytochrome b subunit
MSVAVGEAAGKPQKVLIYRHSLLVRITHWINVVCILFLVMSGLQIFNAHPALYWGEQSHFDDPLVSIGPEKGPDGWQGVTRVFGKPFETTGVLGLSTGPNGELAGRAFPSSVTIPGYQDLATGRRWHFFFAWLFVINGVVYVTASFLNRHVWRDLIPSRAQLRGIGKSVLDHASFRFDHGRDYNVLQKLTYLGLIFIVLPLIVLAGLAMSPGLDAAFPFLVDLFAGRQTARTLHFVAATLIVLFVVIHLVMVLISGVFNNMRSIITGRYKATVGEEM